VSSSTFKRLGQSELLPRYIFAESLVARRRVLEIGAVASTKGQSARFLSTRGARIVVAADTDLAAVQEAQARLASPTLRFRPAVFDDFESASFDLVIVIADGLSALAASRHAVPVIEALRVSLAGWQIGPIVIAEQARVALGDEVGEILNARCVAILIGERPGLSSPDSLGIYLTWHPRVGRIDAERNCISNIRPAGLSYEHAATKLVALLEGAKRLGATGVNLKEDDGETQRIR
jgi:hypothetical protein